MSAISQALKATFPVDRAFSSDEWYTPEEIMIKVRLVLGTIDLDPCSCLEANKVVKAKKFYTIQQDGLRYVWRGRVWLNPPRGVDEQKSIQSIWIKRLLVYVKRGFVPETMFIIRASIGYNWFNNILDRCPNVCFLRERPAYYRGFVNNVSGSDQLTGAVFYVGSDIAKFQKNFSSMGYTFDKNSYR